MLILVKCLQMEMAARALYTKTYREYPALQENPSSCHFKINAKISRLMDMFNTDSPKIRLRIIDTIGFNAACMAFDDFLGIPVICIDDADAVIGGRVSPCRYIFGKTLCSSFPI